MSQATRINATQSAPESGNLLLQRKCACSATASGLTDQCDECATKHMLGLQTKLTVSEPGDRYEQEADRVADEVMRMPAPGIQRQVTSGEDEEEESLQLKPMNAGTSVQRQAEEDEDDEELLQTKALPGHAPIVTPTVSNRINAMRGNGSPLPESARAFYEPRFGVDFGKTRVHTGTFASDTARSLNARAFTLGQDIFFNTGELQPGTANGRRLLAHELTHVVQQAGGRLGRPAVSASRGTLPSHVISPARPALMRLSPERFKKRLGRTPEQRTVIDALFNHPTFRKLWDWIGKCEGKRADHGPIKLRVGRAYSDDKQTVGPGVPAFGVFNETRGILKINPNYREAGKRVARENPQELVDTVVHELVHAASWALRTGKCPGQQEPLPQTEGLVEEDDRRLFVPKEPGYKPKPTDRLPLREELERFERLGPSASDPCNYFLDIKAAPQEEIVEITDDIRRQTGIGGPTRTRVNQILRDEIRHARGASPEAPLAAAPLLRGFMRCRDEECAKRRRRRNIARCFDEVLANEQGVASQTGQESAADADSRDGIASDASPSGQSIQRKCEASAVATLLQQSIGAGDRPPRAKHAPERTPAVTTDISRRIDAMRGAGTPMTASDRAFFQPRFGADFSGTRIHTGQPAAEAARALNARAFTLGKEIYFGSGEYQPATARGGRLLAHELAHVVQHANGAAAGLRRAPAEGAVLPPMTTNYRFDTARITLEDLSDPDIIQRLHALTRRQLRDYRRRVADQDVKDYIDRLLVPKPNAQLETNAAVLTKASVDAIAAASYWEQRTMAAFDLSGGVPGRLKASGEERDAVYSALWQAFPRGQATAAATKLVTIPPNARRRNALLYEFEVGAPRAAGGKPVLDISFKRERPGQIAEPAPKPPKGYVARQLSFNSDVGFPESADTYFRRHRDERRQIAYWLKQQSGEFEQLVITKATPKGAKRPPVETLFHVSGKKEKSGEISELHIELRPGGPPVEITPQDDYRSRDYSDLLLEQQQSTPHPKKGDMLGDVDVTGVPGGELMSVKFAIVRYFRDIETRDAEADVVVPIAGTTKEVFYTLRFRPNNDVDVERVGEKGASPELDPTRMDIARVRDYAQHANDSAKLKTWLGARYPGIKPAGATTEELRASANTTMASEAGTPAWYKANYKATVLDGPATQKRLRNVHKLNAKQTPDSDNKDFTSDELKLVELSLQTLTEKVLSLLRYVRLGRKKTHREADGTAGTYGGQTFRNGSSRTIVMYDNGMRASASAFRGGPEGVNVPQAMLITHEVGHVMQARTNGKAAFDKFVKAAGIRPFTHYAESKPDSEFFPEAFAIYQTDPEWLRRNHFTVYQWMAEFNRTGKAPK